MSRLHVGHFMCVGYRSGHEGSRHGPPIEVKRNASNASRSALLLWPHAEQCQTVKGRTALPQSHGQSGASSTIRSTLGSSILVERSQDKNAPPHRATKTAKTPINVRWVKATTDVRSRTTNRIA